MTELYAHQREGVNFLHVRKAAMLCDDMGLGKTRQALVAALQLYRERKINRILVLAPAAVRLSWRDEIAKLVDSDEQFVFCDYAPKNQEIVRVAGTDSGPAVVLVSYALLPQQRHVEALEKWCEDGKTLLICDESSFLKNRTAKQTKSAAQIARSCIYRWMLTGTPVANSPLDLYAQALVMANGDGPLRAFRNYYAFRARYAVLKLMNMGQVRFQQVVGYQNLPELTKRFAPYVLRREKKDCLDLPDKTYTVREVALTVETWKIYQELKREAMLCLPDTDERPEPNAAVRILRLCQLTSGHVGATLSTANEPVEYDGKFNQTRDVSSEKLSWLTEEILNGELSQQPALIVWCRWRRERERLKELLMSKNAFDNKPEVYEIYGGQGQKTRDANINLFLNDQLRRVLLAQPHAGGYGLNLTAASTAVYLSNDFSYTTRVQSEDRIHRIGQHSACLYLDVLATGPAGQRTVDHHVVECLRNKKDLATLTCSAWRAVLE